MISAITTDDMIALAKAAASTHGLDPALVCAVCEHESGWDPLAGRFEPAFYVRYISAQDQLSPTEAYARSFSWGLMQVMGQTARELGLKTKYPWNVLDPTIGIEFGCRKLANCFKLHPGDVNKALLAYNGGSNPLYPSLVLPLMTKYQ